MTRPGQNADAARVVRMVAEHGGAWHPRLIDADFYDTRRALAIIDARVAELTKARQVDPELTRKASIFDRWKGNAHVR